MTPNPRFAGKDRAAYVALMGQLGLPFPERIQQSLQVNQSGFEADEVLFPQVADVAAVPLAEGLARTLRAYRAERG